jgi:hypothetical protein
VATRSGQTGDKHRGDNAGGAVEGYIASGREPGRSLLSYVRSTSVRDMVRQTSSALRGNSDALPTPARSC